jgi:hypothetical protein
VNLFQIGSPYITPGALSTLEASGVSVSSLLVRHAHGNWGDINAEDARENELSVLRGFRIIKRL